MTAKTVNADLPAEIFDVQTNVPLIHQVVVAQLAAARQGTHATKTRGEVRGGGRKPYRQKGTGRARQGSTRAPQFAGGGTVHGPQPRDYAQRTPKKMKAAALRGALSDRARHGRVHVVASLVSGETPSTKDAVALLTGLTERPNLLVVLDRSDLVSMKSVRNLDNVHVLVADQLNTYDVLCADDVVFTQAALDAFVNGAQPVGGAVATEAAAAPAKAEKPAKATKAAATADKPAKAEKPATLVDTADGAEGTAGGFGPDSHAATEDGSAPEGFDVKGNKDSMKYHVPGSRWYDATEAEVWFRSADAAKAAGFVPAGGEKAQQVSDEAEEESK
ncbi:LSU ribosomal protein L4P [Knoellia remsis]|uniref:Large ribosomal subunit protein uL4 n=1 Tax=Knoellia remsis TaxID=407159 RepID=A0A2T0TVW3_9MICO|nr:50S ribosomal protein L4 [Knoellia remsis]PRY49824.1 LSU ribosomal protein L4P [Knoellia remsis]